MRDSLSSGELDGGAGTEGEVILHALVAAGFLDDQAGVDGVEVGVDLVGVEAESESGAIQPQAGRCPLVRLWHLLFLPVGVVLLPGVVVAGRALAA